MPGLRQVVDHTGAAGPAGLEPGQHRSLGLGSCGGLVAAALPLEQRRSLRNLAAALPTLPPITLEARVSGHADEVAPSRPFLTVDVSSGAVVETVVNFFAAGVPATPTTTSVAYVDGQRIDGTLYAGAVFSAPGTYEAVVRRVGVTGSGVVTLERRLTFRVRSAEPTPPAPPPPPAPAPAPAGPVCQVELAGQQPFGGVTNLRVFGGGFVPGDALTVVQDGGAATGTVADGLGAYSVVLGVLGSVPQVPHLFRVVSDATGASTGVVSFTV